MAAINSFPVLSNKNDIYTSAWNVLRSRSVSTISDGAASDWYDSGSPQKSHSFSTINVDRCCCRELDFFNFPSSMPGDCDEPKQHFLADRHQFDFSMLVTAIDIKQGDSAQTSQTLLDLINNENQQDNVSAYFKQNPPSKGPFILPQGPERPHRCPNSLKILAASKCLECYECEEKRVVLTGQAQDDGSQTEPWWVAWTEVSQTGPSLTAVGPFCRLDYTLRRSRSYKTNVFLDCCRPERPEDIFVCGRDRDVSSNFQQQVSSLDINNTESEQTEHPEDIEKAYMRILYGSYSPQDPETLWQIKISPFDFESPYTWDGKLSEPARCFEMQVSQHDICSTNLTQTDRCLHQPYMCRKSRKFYKIWKKACLMQNEPPTPPPQIQTAVVCEVEQQVSATDIGDTNETQTCLYLCKRKSFRSAVSPHDVKRRENKLELSGRDRDLQINMFEPCCPATETASLVDASNQISQSDISTSAAVQTCDQTPKLNKSYIRRQKRACKSWC